MGATLTVGPIAGPLAAEVQVPGSKSIANRALVCAALADGSSQLTGVAPGDDTAAMLDCLERLGARISVDGDTATVEGTAGILRRGPIVLPARLAGTTSRFVTAVAALGPGPYTVDGLEPLRRRPMTALHDALAALGAEVRPHGEWGQLPIEVRGPIGVDGPARVEMPGDVSSQFVTALMLVAPYLHDGLRITLTTPLVSRPYVAITAAVMASFGVGGADVGERAVVVPAGAYRAAAYAIEPDASSASYSLAAAAIVGGTVTVPGLTPAALQGDARFAEILAAMGCVVQVDGRGTSITRRGGALRGIDIDMADLSDLVPTLAAVAAFATSPTTIRGVGFIRHKESDRIDDLCRELQALGVAAAPTADGLRVEPSVPRAGTVDTHHDHRLAMALALVGLGGAGVTIRDPDVVTKSWPGYWKMLEGLT